MVRRSFLIGFAGLFLAAPLAAQVRLRTIIEKRVFFESEPVYVVVELANQSSDTARIPWFPLVYRRLRLSLFEGDKRVQGDGLAVNTVVPEDWNGIALPPKGHLYEAVVLQVWWGEDAGVNGVFRKHLPPGQYELRTDFNPTLKSSNPLPLLESKPVIFEIRPRTSSESNMLREVETLRRAASANRQGSVEQLTQWAESKLQTEPADPFLPYMLSYGLVDLAARGAPRNRPIDERIKSLKRNVVARRLEDPSIAVVVEVMRSDTVGLVELASKDTTSLGAQIARYHVDQSKKRPR